MNSSANPELIVRGIVIQENRLLVNQSANKKTREDYVALPGGHLEPGESCIEAVVREFVEELGVEVTVGELCFVTESMYPGRKANENYRHELVLYFNVKLESKLKEENGCVHSPEPKKNFRWLPLGELPNANLLPATARQFLLCGDFTPEKSHFSFDDTTNR